MKIGVLLYTHNRTDDARINMEIIRNVWSKKDALKDITMVHSFNGEKGWWPEKYLEDELLYLKNPGHFAGAEVLINEGVRCFQEKHPNVDYVVLLASDTWLMKPEYLENVLGAMQKEKKHLATSVWGTKKLTNIWKRGCALDFSVFDLKWTTESKLFPIRYKEFKDRFGELFFYNDQTIYLKILFMVRFLEAVWRSGVVPSENILKRVADEHIYRMREREPVHQDGQENLIFKINYFRRKMYWPDIGLATYHEPEPKRCILKKIKLNGGESMSRLLGSKDLSYYNRGIRKTRYVRRGKNIDYGD